jgi:hypothetical protein
MQAGWRGAIHKSADQSGYADFVFPIGASSKPGTFKIVAEIHGSNISEAQSFEVIPGTTSGGRSTTGSTTSGR